MQAIVHAADIQDRDGGVLLMSSLFGLFPFLLKLYADSGYQGPKFQQGLSGSAGRSTSRSSSAPTSQVRRAAQALDRRADHRLAEPLPAAWPRIGNA